MHKKYLSILAILLTITSVNLISSQEDSYDKMFNNIGNQLAAYVNSPLGEADRSQNRQMGLPEVCEQIRLMEGDKDVGEIVRFIKDESDGKREVSLGYKMSKEETKVMDLSSITELSLSCKIAR